MTKSLSPIGEPPIPKYGCSDGAGFCHTSFPVVASKADTMPVTPSVYNFPLWKSGVAFGPAPCLAAASAIL